MRQLPFNQSYLVILLTKYFHFIFQQIFFFSFLFLFFSFILSFNKRRIPSNRKTGKLQKFMGRLENFHSEVGVALLANIFGG